MFSQQRKNSSQTRKNRANRNSSALNRMRTGIEALNYTLIPFIAIALVIAYQAYANLPKKERPTFYVNRATTASHADLTLSLSIEGEGRVGDEFVMNFTIRNVGNETIIRRRPPHIRYVHLRRRR